MDTTDYMLVLAAGLAVLYIWGRTGGSGNGSGNGGNNNAWRPGLNTLYPDAAWSDPLTDGIRFTDDFAITTETPYAVDGATSQGDLAGDLYL